MNELNKFSQDITESKKSSDELNQEVEKIHSTNARIEAILSKYDRLYLGSEKTSLETEASRADKTPIGIESDKQDTNNMSTEEATRVIKLLIGIFENRQKSIIIAKLGTDICKKNLKDLLKKSLLSENTDVTKEINAIFNAIFKKESDNAFETENIEKITDTINKSKENIEILTKEVIKREENASSSLLSLYTEGLEALNGTETTINTIYEKREKTEEALTNVKSAIRDLQNDITNNSTSQKVQKEALRKKRDQIKRDQINNITTQENLVAELENEIKGKVDLYQQCQTNINKKIKIYL